MKMQVELEQGYFLFQKPETAPSGTLNSYNYPKYGIGIKNNDEAWIVDNSMGQFKLVTPGLTGQAGTVSFESLDKPGYFLRHQNFLFYLRKREEADLFKKDSTFFARADKFYKVRACLSFEKIMRFGVVCE